nr:hypothetical protein [Rhizobium sp. G21]
MQSVDSTDKASPKSAVGAEAHHDRHADERKARCGDRGWRRLFAQHEPAEEPGHQRQRGEDDGVVRHRGEAERAHKGGHAGNDEHDVQQRRAAHVRKQARPVAPFGHDDDRKQAQAAENAAARDHGGIVEPDQPREETGRAPGGGGQHDEDHADLAVAMDLVEGEVGHAGLPMG